MTTSSATTQNGTFVAIDVAKLVHEVLIEPPTGRRQRSRVGNCQSDFVTLRDRLRAFQTPVLIGFEATGNYHRPLAYYLDLAERDLIMGLGEFLEIVRAVD